MFSFRRPLSGRCRLSLAVLAVIAPVAITLPSIAAPAAMPGAQSAILARHDGFKKMGRAMKALIDQGKSDAPAKPIMRDAAQTILNTAKVQGGLFPEGSGPASGFKTDALPAIWTDKAKFNSDMAALVTAAGKLTSVVDGGNIDAIRAQTKAVGATCGACHRQFRKEDD